MSAVCPKCGWVIANPESGCLDCAWEEYNKLKDKIGEDK
jgi:predicted  nucleic acid-binding Zn-ribbon protein